MSMASLPGSSDGVLGSPAMAMAMAGIDLYAMKNSPFIFKATDFGELIGKLGKGNFKSVFSGLGCPSRRKALDTGNRGRWSAKRRRGGRGSILTGHQGKGEVFSGGAAAARGFLEGGVTAVGRIVGLFGVKNLPDGEGLVARNSRVRFCGSLWAYATVLEWCGLWDKNRAYGLLIGPIYPRLKALFQLRLKRSCLTNPSISPLSLT